MKVEKTTPLCSSTCRVLFLLISTPSLGVYYFCRWLSLSVHLSVSLSQTLLLFCSRWNRAIWPSVLHDKNYNTVFFSTVFDLGPLTPKIYSPKFSSVGHWVSHSLWPWVIVCGSTIFGIGAEIQSPTGLFSYLSLLKHVWPILINLYSLFPFNASRPTIQCASQSLLLVSRHRRRSSVTFGERHFCPKN